MIEIMKLLREAVMGRFASLVIVFIWMAGVVLAKGFWSVLLACVMPLWSVYLVVEKIMMYSGII